MTNIIIYTNEETLLHKQGKFQNDPDESPIGEYYWELPNRPVDLKAGEKIFFATKKQIRGYFEIEDIDDIYSGVQIVFLAKSWKDIRPIHIKPFRGFKYMSKSLEFTKK